MSTEQKVLIITCVSKNKFVSRLLYALHITMNEEIKLMKISK